VIGTVAVTDTSWYEFLARRSLPEVNFWTPSDRRRFSAPEFSPFFFKLKAHDFPKSPDRQRRSTDRQDWLRLD
jgi:hypothetical protein